MTKPMTEDMIEKWAATAAGSILRCAVYHDKGRDYFDTKAMLWVDNAAADGILSVDRATAKAMIDHCIEVILIQWESNYIADAMTWEQVSWYSRRILDE